MMNVLSPRTPSGRKKLGEITNLNVNTPMSVGGYGDEKRRKSVIKSVESKKRKSQLLLNNEMVKGIIAGVDENENEYEFINLDEKNKKKIYNLRPRRQSSVNVSENDATDEMMIISNPAIIAAKAFEAAGITTTTITENLKESPPLIVSFPPLESKEEIVYSMSTCDILLELLGNDQNQHQQQSNNLMWGFNQSQSSPSCQLLKKILYQLLSVRDGPVMEIGQAVRLLESNSNNDSNSNNSNYSNSNNCFPVIRIPCRDLGYQPFEQLAQNYIQVTKHLLETRRKHRSLNRSMLLSESWRSGKCSLIYASDLIIGSLPDGIPLLFAFVSDILHDKGVFLLTFQPRMISSNTQTPLEEFYKLFKNILDVSKCSHFDFHLSLFKQKSNQIIVFIASRDQNTLIQTKEITKKLKNSL